MISLQEIQQFILDTIFPIHCLGCDQEGLWLCANCLKTIRFNTQQACPICRQKKYGGVCSACRSKTSLDGLVVCCDYEQPLVKACIHTFKYSGVTSLADPIASLLLLSIHSQSQPDIPLSNNGVLVPVPLHARRLKNRGFNQSKLIAEKVGIKLNMPVADLLIRARYTDSQMTLTREERLTNVIAAFTTKNHFEKIPENVIIIDDVATTLATLHECASVLKSHGAKTVWGLVFARGS